jgi:hypothetical protein
MISLESDKVCQLLTVEQRIFVCQKDRTNSAGMLKTAPCMQDPHASAFLHPSYCDKFVNKGGDTNAVSNTKKAKTA